MRKLLLLPILLAIALSLAPAAASAAVQPQATLAVLRPMRATERHALAVHYVNPFTDRRWIAGRIDMGMDWAALRPLPVVAIGNAVVLGSENHSGWPAGHLIWYQLTDGPLKGDVIYVAEHLRALVPAGRTVRAGQRIATALPGYPDIEMGWATTYGAPRAAPCYREGRATNSGRDMERLLGALGVPLAGSPPPGPAAPAGKLC